MIAAEINLSSTQITSVVVTEVHERALDDMEALDEINSVVSAAIGTWDIPARVKRLALPSYLYSDLDARHLVFIGAWRQQRLIGVAALEPADLGKHTDGHHAMLLHGLFVDPKAHGQGVGSRLVAAAKRASWTRGYSELRVRAERNATGFFLRQGFGRLAAVDGERGYPYQLSAPLIAVTERVA